MSNKLTNIAIVGATGRMGGHMATALLATKSHKVTALTRTGNTKPLPEGLAIKEVDYSSPASITAALRGQDFLIITLSARAPPELQGQICAAAAEAGVKYIMPNLFTAYDPQNKALNGTALGAGGLKRIADVTDTGVKCIAMICGFWYEWSVAMGEQWFGFDVPARKVTFFDDGELKIPTSTWLGCADAVAALLSLPEKGASPSVSDWADKPFYFASFRVSQREMLDSLHRVLGDSDADWEITRQSSEKRVADGAEELKNGDRLGHAKVMYSRIFYPSGEGDFTTSHALANDVLGLPKEKLDEATARIVKMVTEGWNNKIE